jgi:glyoxylase-like metal-dependent hydrolase (beta-lactamase superfamily II)
MTTQIAPGIYPLQVPIPNNPLGNTNLYLLKGQQKHTLIDAGWNAEATMTALRSELNDAGATLNDVDQIIFTHAHFDHYGLAALIKSETGVRILIHRVETSIFPRYQIDEEFIKRFEQWFRINGVPDTEVPLNIQLRARFSGILAAPDVLLEDGDIVNTGSFELKVFWTPGHSPGHICLYEPQNKILFSGDHILPVITPNISLTPDSPGDPLGDFLKSLRRLRQLDVKTVAPAHEQIFHNLPQRIDEIIRHHEERQEEILAALRKDTLTGYELSTRITWLEQVGGVPFNKLSPFDKRAAIAETLAHLKALENDNKVRRVEKNLVVYYKVV